MGIRTNPWNNPAIGQAFESIAQLYAPLRAADVYAYTKAAAAKQEAQRLADLFTKATDPNTPRDVIDRYYVGTGHSPTQTYYSIDQQINAANARNAADNANALERERLQQQGLNYRQTLQPINVGRDATAFLPAPAQKALGLGATLEGQKSLQPGETVMTAGGQTLQGAPQPMTLDQVRGRVANDLVNSGGLTRDQQVNMALGIHPKPPKFGVIGEDAYGNKQYGYAPAYDPATAGKPINATPQNLPAEAPLDPNLRGEDLLKTLDPQTQGQVRAIIEGRAPYPNGMLLKTPYGQKLSALVTQADPLFETGNAGARMRVRNEFTAGSPNSPAGAITAGNTALQHLGLLSDLAEKLGNYDSGIPGNNIANTLKNEMATASGQGGDLIAFQNALNKFSEEATRFYRGVGGNEADIKRELESLNPNLSPTQLRAAINAQADLMNSKIGALQDRWKTGMGPLVPDFPIVHPEAQQALERIRSRTKPAQQAPAQAAQPQASGGYADGTIAQNPTTGEKLIRQGGKWVPMQ